MFHCISAIYTSQVSKLYSSTAGAKVRKISVIMNTVQLKTFWKDVMSDTNG
jgi:hypothetical protein